MTQFTHTTAPGSLSIDTVTDLLADRRRRHAVAVLADRGSAMALRSLARAVASRDPDCEDGEPPATDALAIALHHVHLPKLDDRGVVDYDHEEKIVVPRDVEALAACLEASRSDSSQQSDAVSAN